MNKYAEDCLARAKYARGYLISPRQLSASEIPLQWGQQTIWCGTSPYYVYYDIRNEVCFQSEGGCFVFILGTVLDPERETMSQEAIAKVFLNLLPDESKVFDYLDVICGRHIIIYGSGDSVSLVQDTCGMRSCFYGSEFISSHYGLINELEKHRLIDYWGKYNEIEAESRPWYLPGDLTPYEGVFALVPNHALQLLTHKVRRIFPREDVRPADANDVVAYFAKMLKAQARTLAKRFQILISLTGGNDSRVSLSALCEVKDRALAFAYNDHSSREKSSCQYDNAVADRLAKVFGIEFRRLDLESIPRGLLDIIFQNHYHQHAPWAVMKYLTELPEGGIHVRSNLLEIIRERNYFRVAANTSQELAKTAYGERFSQDPFVQQAFSDYHSRNQYEDIHGYDISDLFYMEYRMGIWHGGACLLTSDIALDTYCLFNQRKLLDMGLRMPDVFRHTNFIVYETIGRLCPEISFMLPNHEDCIVERVSPFGHMLMPRLKDVAISKSGQNAYFKRLLESGDCEFGFSSDGIARGAAVSVRMDIGLSTVKRIVSFAALVFAGDWNAATKCRYEIYVNGAKINHVPGLSAYRRLQLHEVVLPSNEQATLEVRLIYDGENCANGDVCLMRLSSFVQRFKCD